MSRIAEKRRIISLILCAALVFTSLMLDSSFAFAESDETEVSKIELNLDRNDNRVIGVTWKAVEGADYYTLSMDDGEALDSRDDAALDELSYTFENLDPKEPHTIRLKAYSKNEDEDELVGEAELRDVYAYVKGDTNRMTVGSSVRSPRNTGINLRTALGESRTGYSVVQGGTTDGEYVYQLMVSPYNQNGRVLKVRARDNAVMARSAVIDINHGNGMAYDSRRRRLVIVGREGQRNQLTIVNVGTKEKDVPSFAGYRYVNYEYSDKWAKSKSNFDSYGVSAISYVEKYDCYIAMQRQTKDLLVLNPEFKVIGKINTKILAKYPGLYQAIDADERYVYILLSPYNAKQPHNIVLVMDWHGEKVLDYVNGKEACISSAWSCGSDGSPSAVIRTQTPYEAENIYHIYNEESGRSRLYLSEYYNSPQYKWVTKKKKVKVKWKKVKKKVKWKRVKKKGKWRWKYKKKKVWKYKKKTKKYKVKVFNYYQRDNFVYDLGEI